MMCVSGNQENVVFRSTNETRVAFMTWHGRLARECGPTGYGARATKIPPGFDFL